MKAVVKKRVISRKKQTKLTKTKSVSTKITSKRVKSKKPSADSNKPVNQALIPSTRKGKARNPSGKGGFKKGKSGNPKGRPKLGYTKDDNLRRKIRQVEHDLDVNTLEDFIERSLTSDTMAIALMKKRYPDLKSIEQVTIAADSMTQKEAADIRKEIAKRFKTK